MFKHSSNFSCVLILSGLSSYTHFSWTWILPINHSLKENYTMYQVVVSTCIIYFMGNTVFMTNNIYENYVTCNPTNISSTPYCVHIHQWKLHAVSWTFLYPLKEIELYTKFLIQATWKNITYRPMFSPFFFSLNINNNYTTTQYNLKCKLKIHYTQKIYTCRISRKSNFIAILFAKHNYYAT